MVVAINSPLNLTLGITEMLPVASSYELFHVFLAPCTEYLLKLLLQKHFQLFDTIHINKSLDVPAHNQPQMILNYYLEILYVA